MLQNKKVAIAFAMWQRSEAWELAHKRLTLVDTQLRSSAAFSLHRSHTNTKKTDNSKVIRFLAVRRGLELRSSRADTL